MALGRASSLTDGPVLKIIAEACGSRVRLEKNGVPLSLLQPGIPWLGRQWAEVSVDGLEKLPYRRLVLLFAAMHCQLGGALCLRSDDQRGCSPALDAIWQDSALVLGGSFEMRELRRSDRWAESHFRKVRALEIETRRNTGLTLGIISGGAGVETLERCLSSFQSAAGIIDEILVCGPASRGAVAARYSKVRLIEFDDEGSDIRPAICAKKNRIAAESRCENLLIVHERIRPAPAFEEVYRRLTPHFEVLACPLRDTEGNRISGWNMLPYHDDTPMARIGSRIAAPGDLSPMHFGIGSAIFAKADVYRRIPLDERLHWGEMEDNHWYRRLWLDGVSVGTIDGLLVSAVGTGSPAARRQRRIFVSRYDAMHRWLPGQCRTAAQHVAFTAGILCRAGVQVVLGSLRTRRDLVASLPKEGRARL